MLREGIYHEVLDQHCNKISLMRVYPDKSHSLKIVTLGSGTEKPNLVELHSQDEARNLYNFLKKHFDGENQYRFTHEEYLEYVAQMKFENCPEDEIEKEEVWRAALEKEFGGKHE